MPNRKRSNLCSKRTALLNKRRRELRSQETPAQRESRLLTIRQCRERSLLKESEEARAARLADQRIRNQRSLLKESAEAREARLADQRIRSQRSLREESEEAREARLADKRIRNQRSLDKESAEAREARLADKRIRNQYSFLKETAEAREARLANKRSRYRRSLLLESAEAKEARLADKRSRNQHSPTLISMMKPESKRVIRQVQQNFDHSVWTINDRRCLSKALKSLSIDEIKQNAKHIFENKSPLEIDCFIKRMHHSRESYSKIKNCNPEFKYIECTNLWSQLMYDIIGDKAHDNNSLMIGKLMALIGNNEVPKNPEKTNGVNYRVIYDYLASVLMGLPAPTLKPLESAVILELLETMLCKLSVSNLEAHKKMLLWKYETLTGKHGSSSKMQIQKALENDFQNLDTSDLSDSAKKRLLQPGRKRGKQQELLYQLLMKRNKVANKPNPKHAAKDVVKNVTDKNSTVIYEIQHIDELLADGTKATVVKLNPIVVSLADPTMKPLWENNEEPALASDSEKTTPKNTTLVEDNVTACQVEETTSKYVLQKDKASSDDPVGAVASFSRSQEMVKRPREEDDAISRKFQKMEDYSQKYCQNDTFSEPLKSLMFMPDSLWINPFCIPSHLINIEVSENQSI